MGNFVTPCVNCAEKMILVAWKDEMQDYQHALLADFSG
jgi:hypothetical protein